MIPYYVIHTCEGSFEGSVAWLCNEDSLVSAHAVIGDGLDGDNDGLIAQLAAWDDVCWHAGVTFEPSTPLYVPGVNPNRVSRGLEFAGFHDRPLTEKQVQAGADLIRLWRSLDGWVVPLAPHSALATGGPNVRSDPGAANLAALEAALEDVMSPEEFRQRFLEVYAEIGVADLFRAHEAIMANLNGRIVALEIDGHTGTADTAAITAELATLETALQRHDDFIAKIKALG